MVLPYLQGTQGFKFELNSSHESTPSKPWLQKSIAITMNSDLLWMNIYVVGEVFWLLIGNSAEIEFFHSGYLVINDIATSGWEVIMPVLPSLTESFKLPEY